MTNDETINVLKNAALIGAAWIGDEKQFYDLLDAVKMAVEALKAQLSKEDATSDLQQTCNQLATDAISRQAVKEMMCVKHCTAYPTCQQKYGCYKTHDLELLPSVQPTNTNTLKSLDCVDRQAVIDVKEGSERDE